MKFSHLRSCLTDICMNIEKTVYSVGFMKNRDSYDGPTFKVVLQEAIRNQVRVTVEFSFWYGFHYACGDDWSSGYPETLMVEACELAVDRINKYLPKWFVDNCIDDQFNYKREIACVYHDEGCMCGVESIGSIEGWLYLE